MRFEPAASWCLLLGTDSFGFVVLVVLEVAVETLDIGEHTLPVGGLHPDHVLHVQERGHSVVPGEGGGKGGGG